MAERQRHQAERAGNERDVNEPRRRDAAGSCAVASAECSRDERTDGDRQADVHRDQQECELRGIADSRREIGVAEA